MLANAAVAAVPQAMAGPVALWGWVMSGKGIIGNLLWGTLPHVAYKDIWGLMECSLSRQTEHLPESTWLFVVWDQGKSMNDRHRGLLTEQTQSQ